VPGAMSRQPDRTIGKEHELSTLLEVSRDIVSTLELEPLLDLILERLESVVSYTSAMVLALEDDSLSIQAYRGTLSRQDVVGARHSTQDNYFQLVLSSRQPVVIPDVQSNAPETRLIPELANEHTPAAGMDRPVHSWLGAPLVTKERVTGLLALAHNEPNYFTGRHVEIVAAFANQVAVALENARLFAAEQRRAEQFRAISEIGRRITSILSVDDLLNETARLIQDMMGCYHVHLGMVEGDVVVFKACSGVWRTFPECQYCAPFRLRVGEEGVCGWVAGTGEVALVPDVTKDPRYVAVEVGLTGSELALPVKIKGQVIGVLDVESERLNAFDDSDVRVLQSLADQVAVALENVQLHERTRQLAALQERQKLARELHDSVSQALFGIALGARTARTQLDIDPNKAAEPLDYVLSLADAALAEMRALIFELRPESLEREGLVAALTRQAVVMRSRHHIEVSESLCEEPAIPLDVKHALYRITQEAMHNIIKHARASRVELLLEYVDGAVRLEVNDNGVGFDPQGDFPGHLGLRTMQERAAIHGGVVKIESSPERGTRLSVEIPVTANGST
jgi:signal transduction histidine kinase